MTTKAIEAVPDATGNSIEPAANGPADAMLQMIERIATMPEVNVDNLERLLAMQERVMERQAQTAFNQAMQDAQSEMRRVAPDAYNPSTKSKYASYGALDRALRPIYTQHGFSLSFDTGDAPHENEVRVLCHVAHRAGFTRTYKIDMPADGKGAKGGDVMTKTHATGSGLSYGQRYLLKAIFNIAVSEDDDGNRAGSTDTPDMPSGYQDWQLDFELSAENGVEAVRAGWKAAKAEYRNYANKHDTVWITKVREKARKAHVAQHEETA